MNNPQVSWPPRDLRPENILLGRGIDYAASRGDVFAEIYLDLCRSARQLPCRPGGPEYAPEGRVLLRRADCHHPETVTGALADCH